MNFAEMFCGVGGFRFGLEKCVNPQSWFGNEEGQHQSFIKGSDGRFKQELRSLAYEQESDSNSSSRSTSIRVLVCSDCWQNLNLTVRQWIDQETYAP